MAHLNLHVAVGLAAGTAVTAWPVARAWIGARPVATAIARVVIASVACATWACLPSLLGHREAWWSNVFFAHAAIDRRIRGGLLIGEMAIAAWLVALYLGLLLAMRRARGPRQRSPYADR